MDDKWVNEVLLFAYFFFLKSRDACFYNIETPGKSIRHAFWFIFDFLVHLPATRSPLSSFISRTLSLSFCLSLSFGLYSVGRVFHYGRKSLWMKRDLREMLPEPTARFPPPFTLGSPAIIVESVVLALCWAWVANEVNGREWENTCANISARVNLVLSTGFLIGRSQLRFVGPSPWNLLNTLASERERRSGKYGKPLRELQTRTNIAREKLS